MPINKDLILKLVFSFIFIGICLRVLIPIIYDYLIKKLPGHYDKEGDIDTLIRRQKERLRSQYGLPHHITSSHSLPQKESRIPSSPEIQQLHKENQWGGGKFLVEIQSDIYKHYSYTLSETKVQAFLKNCEKENVFFFLSDNNQSNFEAIKNFLVIYILLMLLVEEVRDKKFFILAKIAKKIGVSNEEFALSIQIKILMILQGKKGLKEERVYADQLVLNQYSEATLKEATLIISHKEANLWAKGASLFFEELSLAMNYASFLSPMPKIKNRKDIDTAYLILGATKEQPFDEIKKIYKKIALQRHPDKIVSQKLPLEIERKAIEKFNRIQEAYEIITEQKK